MKFVDSLPEEKSHMTVTWSQHNKHPDIDTFTLLTIKTTKSRRIAVVIKDVCEVSLLPEIFSHQHFILIDDHAPWSWTQEVLRLVLALEKHHGSEHGSIITQNEMNMIIIIHSSSWQQCLLYNVDYWLLWYWFAGHQILTWCFTTWCHQMCIDG